MSRLYKQKLLLKYFRFWTSKLSELRNLQLLNLIIISQKMDQSSSPTTSISISIDMVLRMKAFVLKNNDRLDEIECVDFWNDFTLAEDEVFTPEELRDAFMGIVNMDIDNITEIDNSTDDQDILFLNWNHSQNERYKQCLEYNHLFHVSFSLIVSTPEEIQNNVFLSKKEIARRISDIKDEYDITGIIPDYLELDYSDNILTKIKERCNLEKNMEAELEQFLNMKKKINK